MLIFVIAFASRSRNAVSWVSHFGTARFSCSSLANSAFYRAQINMINPFGAMRPEDEVYPSGMLLSLSKIIDVATFGAEWRQYVPFGLAENDGPLSYKLGDVVEEINGEKAANLARDAFIAKMQARPLELKFARSIQK